MSKFNKTTKEITKIQNTPDTINAAGTPAFDRNNIKQDIVNVVLTSMLSGNSFYETEAERLKRIEVLCSEPEISLFVAKAMVYTRTVGNLRSISHFLAILLTENAKGTDYLRHALVKSFQRLDDLSECLALWNSRNPGKMVPNSLRRAFKDRLEKSSAYELKKYEAKNSSVKLRDVVKLSRPNPELTGDSDLFKKLIESRLPKIQTAQTVNAESTGVSRADNYKSMLREKKLGYMAALKNIKNIIQAGADEETIDLLCEFLRNEKACLNSKCLPFRYIDAYNEIKSLNSTGIDIFLIKKLSLAIEDGFRISSRNIGITEPGEKVAILLDESGSMYGEPFNIGKSLMASMLTGLDKSSTIGYLWARDAREISVNGSPFDFIDRVRAHGGGTNLGSAFDELIKTGTKVDKIVVFTDEEQTYFGDLPSMVRKYRKISPGVKILFWNLKGYSGGTPLKLSDSILEVSGFSDKLLEVAGAMLKFGDLNYLVNEIEKIEL